MNKLIFLLPLFFVSLSSFAQTSPEKSIAWKVGLFFSPDVLFGISHLYTGPYTEYKPESATFNFTSGLTGQLVISPKITLGTGLAYSTKDFTGTFYCYTCDLLVVPEPEFLKHHFLEVPFYLRYNIVESKVDLQVHAGFTPGIVVNRSKLYYEERYQPSQWIVSAELGVGTEIELGEKFSLSILGMYRRSLFTLKTHSLSLQTGILYAL